jgi:hypothetical protein
MAIYDDPGLGLPILWAGGFSDDPGSPLYCGLAFWDGQVWTPAFPGMAGSGMSLAVHDDDGPGPHPPALYAAGHIPIFGPSLSNIARWDGHTWIALPFFGGSSLAAIASYDTDGNGPSPALLFAGGTTPATSNGLRSWNGTNWMNITIPGLTSSSNYVNGLFVVQGTPPLLFAAGSFYQPFVGDVHLVKWDGLNWQIPPDAPRLYTYAGGLFDDDGAGPLPPAHYFAGSFGVAGNQPSSNFARFGCPTCYPNCDASTASPILNVADYICFLNKYAAFRPLRQL